MAQRFLSERAKQWPNFQQIIDKMESERGQKIMSKILLFQLNAYPEFDCKIPVQSCRKVKCCWKVNFMHSLIPVNWLSWDLTTRQPLWVNLCHLPEKGRKATGDIVEEMKERDREERGTGMKVKTEEIKTFPPSTLTNYKDSRPCPTVSQSQLDTLVT